MLVQADRSRLLAVADNEESLVSIDLWELHDISSIGCGGA
jgi:hypothetical protein